MILIPGLKVWGVQWNLKETKTRNFYPETIDQEVNSSSEEIVRSKTCLTVKSADDDYWAGVLSKRSMVCSHCCDDCATDASAIDCCLQRGTRISSIVSCCAPSVRVWTVFRHALLYTRIICIHMVSYGYWGDVSSTSYPSHSSCRTYS